jgi:hypothetical protein
LLLLNDLSKVDVVVAPCIRARGAITAATMADEIGSGSEELFFRFFLNVVVPSPASR